MWIQEAAIEELKLAVTIGGNQDRNREATPARDKPPTVDQVRDTSKFPNF